MSFRVINEAFTCHFCGHKNTPAFRTCRNHCSVCLSALHVDEKDPGDRKSKCHGEMNLSAVLPHPKHTFLLEHTCTVCTKTIRNRAADDDNRDVIFQFLAAKSTADVRKMKKR